MVRLAIHSARSMAPVPLKLYLQDSVENLADMEKGMVTVGRMSLVGSWLAEYLIEVGTCLWATERIGLHSNTD
jgi:hypothetical protein